MEEEKEKKTSEEEIIKRYGEISRKILKIKEEHDKNKDEEER